MKRTPDTSYEEYRRRRKAEKEATKKKLQGCFIHVSALPTSLRATVGGKGHTFNKKAYEQELEQRQKAGNQSSQKEEEE